MGIWDFTTSGLLDVCYFSTLGLLGTSRPFDFWTLGLYDFSSSGILDSLICRLWDFVDFSTLGLLDLWNFGLLDFGTCDFGTLALLDFGRIC